MLHLGPWTGRKGHGDEAKRSDERCQQLRAQTRQRTVRHGLPQRHAGLAQLIDEADQHDAVEDGDARHCDEADTGRDRERHPAQPKGEDPAGGGERHAREDERCLAETPEPGVDQEQDQAEDRRDDQG